MFDKLIPVGYGPTIPGEGPIPARFMFIGEAGGQMEEHLQRPFVGRSGRRLTALIQRFLGLERSEVYLTNIVKFHPAKNRDPKKAEIVDWFPYLCSEVEAVDPEVVVFVGSVSLRAFFPKKRISAVHGTAWPMENIPPFKDGTIAVAWYHPAAGMRNPKTYRATVTDAVEFYERLVDYEPEVEYALVEEFDALAVAMGSNIIGFDIETTTRMVNKRRVFEHIVGYSVSSGDYSAVYTPVAPLLIVPELEGKHIILVCHNAKF